MKRREFLKTTGLMIGSAAVASPLLNSCRTFRKKPNIVFILADDLGYGELGCYGQDIIKTPHIDTLADQGMIFSQHYAGSPVCAPSRCVLLSGKHTGQAYIRGNDEWEERGEVWDYSRMEENPKLEGQRPIPAETVTIAEKLQQSGYMTACIGKWGLGPAFSEGSPVKQGFNLFFGYICQRQAHNYCPTHLWKNEEIFPLQNKFVPPGTTLPDDADPYDPKNYKKFMQKDYAPDFMLKEALHFIESNKSEPFFLFYPTPLPHVSLQVPEMYVHMYRDIIGEEEPYAGGHYYPCRYPRATYAGMITCLDDQVGKIVQKLRDIGIYENTLIIFTSDNGPTYAGGADTQFFNSAGIFDESYGRGKGFIYEGGIRVPLVAQWPGIIEPGTSSDHISAFWDYFPTFCDITGAESPEHLRGISFLPALQNRKDQNQHQFLYWEFPAYGGQQAVRMGKWKGIRKNIFKGNMQIELYNLDSDPLEKQNIAAAYPAVVKKIEQIMKKEHTAPELENFRIKEFDTGSDN